MLSRKEIEALPKIELHCHLDGSLRPESVLEEARIQNIEIDEENIIELLKAPQDCESLVDYLRTFALPQKVLQTKRSLERFTYEIYEDAHKENVVYLEVRIAPIQHIDLGLTQEEVIEAVIAGIDRARNDFGIEGNVILCCMKQRSEEEALTTVEAGKSYIGKGVVAVDLAGPEDEGFSHKFVKSMNLAREYGYKITIHAGEAASGKNVLEAIELLHADRIGHGVRSHEDLKAYELLQKDQVVLEVCPTSNVQTKAVESLEKHTLKKYINEGVAVSINTDNRTVSDTTMTDEIEKVAKLIDMNVDDYRKIYYNTIGAIFAPDSVKSALKKLL